MGLGFRSGEKIGQDFICRPAHWARMGYRLSGRGSLIHVKACLACRKPEFQPQSLPGTPSADSMNMTQSSPSIGGTIASSPSGRRAAARKSCFLYVIGKHG